MRVLLLALTAACFGWTPSEAWVLPSRSQLPVRLSMTSSSETEVLQDQIQSNLSILKRAADTKQEDSAVVYQALVDLEKQMRQQCKQDFPASATAMKEQLTGDWRLIFTTGTAKTQEKMGRINYFPIKAVQSFETNESYIENGIYVGDFPVIKFSGSMEFDLKKRKLEFDFTKVNLFNFFDVQLQSQQAADIGAKSGLGSDASAKQGRQAFFNWISADADIATARGGGGGLALWKRVVEEES